MTDPAAAAPLTTNMVSGGFHVQRQPNHHCSGSDIATRLLTTRRAPGKTRRLNGRPGNWQGYRHKGGAYGFPIHIYRAFCVDIRNESQSNCFDENNTVVVDVLREFRANLPSYSGEAKGWS